MPIGYSGAPRVTGSNQASRTRRLSRSLTTGNNGTPMRMTLYSSEQFNYYASPVATNTDALRPITEYFSTEFASYSAAEIGYYKDCGYFRLKNMTNGAIVYNYDIDTGFTFVGDLGITGNVAISGTLNTNGAVQFNSTLNAVGAVIFSNTLNTTGAVVFSNTLNTVGAVIFSNTLNTVGAVVFSSTLNTTGAVRFANTLNVEGAVVLNAALNTAGVVTFTNTVNVNTVNGIDFNPGSDVDVDLITIGVTGSPRIFWDESEDKIATSHGIAVTGNSTFSDSASFGFGLGLGVPLSGVVYPLTVLASSGGYAAWFRTTTANAGLLIGSIDPGYVIINPIDNILSNFKDMVLCSVSGKVGIGVVPSATLHVNGDGIIGSGLTVGNYLNVNTVNGIDINPGSDTNVDLITISVTGSPKISWDETSTAFGFSERLVVNPVTPQSSGTGYSILAYGKGRAIETNDTNLYSPIYGIALPGFYSINTGVVDSGERSGINFQNYANEAAFKGRLVAQYGVRYQGGIASGTGTIDSSIGILSQLNYFTGTVGNSYHLYGVTTVTNATVTGTKWGIYIVGETGNYLSGALGLGITPTEKLHVLGNAKIGSNTNSVIVDTEGDLNFTGDGAGLPYCGCCGNEIGWTQATAAQDTWYGISDSDIANGEANNTTCANGVITVGRAGRYLINYGLTFVVSAPNKHVQTGIMVNGTASAFGIMHEEEAVANAEAALSATAILDLAASSTVQIAIRTTDSGTPDLSVDHYNLTLLMVGGT